MKKIITLILLIFITLSLSSCKPIKYHQPFNLGKKMDEKTFMFNKDNINVDENGNNYPDVADFYWYFSGYYDNGDNDGCYEYYYKDNDGIEIDGLVKFNFYKYAEKNNVEYNSIYLLNVKNNNLSFKYHQYYKTHINEALYSVESKSKLGIVLSGSEYIADTTGQSSPNRQRFSTPFVDLDDIRLKVVEPFLYSYNMMEWFTSYVIINGYFKFRLETYKNYYVLYTDYTSGEIVSYYNIKTKCLEYEEYKTDTEHRIFKKSNKLEKLERQNNRLIRSYKNQIDIQPMIKDALDYLKEKFDFI